MGTTCWPLWKLFGAGLCLRKLTGLGTGGGLGFVFWYGYLPVVAAVQPVIRAASLHDGCVRFLSVQ